MSILLEILIAILCIEATTNLLSKSLIFQPLRKYLFNLSNSRRPIFKFIHNIIDCPYCCSVWVSFFYTLMLYLFIVKVLPTFFMWFFVALALHRTANTLHYIMDRLDVHHFIGEGEVDE